MPEKRQRVTHDTACLHKLPASLGGSLEKNRRVLDGCLASVQVCAHVSVDFFARDDNMGLGLGDPHLTGEWRSTGGPALLMPSDVILSASWPKDASKLTGGSCLCLSSSSQACGRVQRPARFTHSDGQRPTKAHGRQVRAVSRSFL